MKKILTYTLLFALFSTGCSKMHEKIEGTDGSLTINTAWSMITSEPEPKKCFAVMFDSLDNYVLSKEIYSPLHTDTFKNGKYSIYEYYFKNDVFAVKNIENYKETQFVVEPNEEGVIPADAELYVSLPTTTEVDYFRGKSVFQVLYPEFTIIDVTVIMTGDISGITSCALDIDNIFNTYDVYTDAPLKNSTFTATSTLERTENDTFYAQSFYLGFDSTNGNAITLNFGTNKGVIGVLKTDLSRRLDSYTNSIKMEITVECQTDMLVDDGMFYVKLKNLYIDNNDVSAS